MRVKLIVAIDEGLAIGNKNALPWVPILEDLERFRMATLYHPIVMGRKTWESLGKRPLDRRHNMILSKTLPMTTNDHQVVRTVEQALCCGDHAQPLWVIGGNETYKAFLPFASEISITHVKDMHEADTFLDPDVLRAFQVCKEVVNTGNPFVNCYERRLKEDVGDSCK